MSEKIKELNDEHQAYEGDVEALENQKELIRTKLDEAERKHHEKQSQNEALEEATTLAEKADHQRKDSSQKESATKEKLRSAPSKKQLAKTFDVQMDGVRAEMDGGSKLFSRIIHIKVIERVSDTIATTIARPNAMFSGSISAFIVITAVYFLARHYGYRLSGSEAIGAFILGWVMGIIYDYLSSLSNKRRS